MKIAIVGSGLSGCNLYNLLNDDNHEIKIFEKARGAGGRCSTRYVNDKFIDHGTSSFKASQKEFLEFCERKVEKSILFKKDGIYYPTKGMNKLCSSLIDKKDLLRSTRVVKAKYENTKWTLFDENKKEFGDFDFLVLTIPTPQILEMDIKISNEISKKLKSVEYDSMALLMIYSYSNLQKLDKKILEDERFESVIDNSQKYNYRNFNSYVIGLNKLLTNILKFQNKDEVEKYMIKLLNSISKIELEKDFEIMAHFWKYAFVSNGLDEEFIYDKEQNLCICSDYFKTGNLEGSYLSSKRVYEKVFK